MRPCLFALSVALVGSASVARAGDPLESAGCREALDALQVQEASLAAGAPDHRDALAQLEASRRHAARACLGGRGDPPLARRFAQPPFAVPPVVVVPPVRLSPPAAAPVVPLPKRAEPPTFVMACDAAGCWASDGSRLNRVGSSLLGPRGLCSVQGAVLHCP